MGRTGDMREQKGHFHWGLLYLLYVGMLGILYLLGRSALTPTGHKLALIGVVLVFYGLVWVWLGTEV